jgi:hypothetical protein
VTQDPTQSSGDYGYDMAHDGTAGGKPPEPPRPPRPAPARPEDQAGDMAYDEAHDF